MTKRLIPSECHPVKNDVCQYVFSFFYIGHFNRENKSVVTINFNMLVKMIVRDFACLTWLIQ